MMFAPKYTVWHCGYLKGEQEMSNAETSAVYAQEIMRLERENAALRLEVEIVVEKNRVLCELLAEAEKKAWVELTKEELQTIFNYEPNDVKHIAFLVESLCKEKNT